MASNRSHIWLFLCHFREEHDERACRTVTGVYELLREPWHQWPEEVRLVGVHVLQVVWEGDNCGVIIVATTAATVAAAAAATTVVTAATAAAASASTTSSRCRHRRRHHHHHHHHHHDDHSLSILSIFPSRYASRSSPASSATRSVSLATLDSNCFTRFSIDSSPQFLRPTILLYMGLTSSTLVMPIWGDIHR